MLEPTLVLVEGRVDLKERAARGQCRADRWLPLGLRRAAAVVRQRISQHAHTTASACSLHVGAPDWLEAYELSKNLHR